MATLLHSWQHTFLCPISSINDRSRGLILLSSIADMLPVETVGWVVYSSRFLLLLCLYVCMCTAVCATIKKVGASKTCVQTRLHVRQKLASNKTAPPLQASHLSKKAEIRRWLACHGGTRFDIMDRHGLFPLEEVERTGIDSEIKVGW